MERQRIINQIEFMEREQKAVDNELKKPQAKANNQSISVYLRHEHSVIKAELQKLYITLSQYDLK